ncbi:MAG TPA: hypothetical protein VGM88_35490 [Kofleriaceae bacterium]
MTARRWSIAIFVAVFAWYLVTASREQPWGDAHPIWDVADAIVTDGTIRTNIRWPEDLPPGRDGATYGIAPIGPALSQVPGAALYEEVMRVVPRYQAVTLPLFAHLAPAAFGALACALFFLLLGDLGVRVRVASSCTAILALATTTWVYARSPYSEAMQLAMFLGMFRQALRVGDAPTRRAALGFGAWAGMLLNAKYVFAVAIVGAACAIAVRLRRDALRVLGWAALAGAPFVALAVWYNVARWGSPLSSGYDAYYSAFFGGSVFDGAWGMLASPNKSIFLYAPPLVVAALMFPRCVRAVPRYGALVLATVVPVILVYCTYRSWSGEYAWGPRFLVWAVPVLLVPIAWAFDRGAAWRWAVRGTVVVGIVVQLLGNALYWDHWIRISILAKDEWLGDANRAGAYVPERGRGHCDSCFEDTYQLLWTPAFQPIAGHWWLLKNLALGRSAEQAVEDAPWSTYTTLQMQLMGFYERARIDWWALAWLDEDRSLAVGGGAILGAQLALLAWAIWAWIRRHRAAD